jgi:hypothetical protein
MTGRNADITLSGRLKRPAMGTLRLPKWLVCPAIGESGHSAQSGLYGVSVEEFAHDSPFQIDQIVEQSH